MTIESVKARIEHCLNEMNLSLTANTDLSSLDLVTLAVRLEKEFGIRFDLDEISLDQFGSLEKLTALIQSKS